MTRKQDDALEIVHFAALDFEVLGGVVGIRVGIRGPW